MTTFDGNIVSYWNFNESSGTSSDDSVDSNDITLAGTNTPTFTTSGKINNGVAFTNNGTAYMGALSGISNLDDTFSIGMWYYSTIDTTATASIQTLMGQRTGTTGTFAVYIRPTNRLGFTLNNIGDYTTANNTTTKDTWLFFVITFNNKTVKMYLNGVEKYSATHTGFTNLLTANGLSFGAGGGGSGGSDAYCFRGTMDCGFLVDKTLSVSEIEELYNSGTGLEFPSGYSKKINGVTAYSKINGVAKASISKVNGV